MPSRLAGDGRVLLVDDDATVRRFFVRALTRAGFEVVEAHDGPDGMARIAEHLPSVVVLDNRMPGMSGLDVLDELRRDPHTQTLPVILVTAQGEIEERVVGLGAGASDYVTKPVHPDELVARVRAQLRGQVAWRDAIERAWRDRAAVVERLGAIDSSAPAAALADIVCEALLDLPGTDAAALLRFEGHDVSVLANAAARPWRQARCSRPSSASWCNGALAPGPGPTRPRCIPTPRSPGGRSCPRSRP